MTITEFLLARIAEDEAVATAATKGPWTVQRGPAYRIEVGRQEYANDPECLTFAVGDDPDWFSDAEHIARYNPARVLAECAAKRAIIERIPKLSDEFRPDWFTGKSALYILAAVYSDHPDYLPEWAL